MHENHRALIVLLRIFFAGICSPETIRDKLITSVYDSTDIRLKPYHQRFIESPQLPGVYISHDTVHRSQTVLTYTATIANNKEPQNPGSYDEMAKYYWDNVTRLEPLYGADWKHNFCEKSPFDLGKMGGSNSKFLAYGDKAEGILDTYGYFGAFGTTYTCHVE